MKKILILILLFNIISFNANAGFGTFVMATNASSNAKRAESAIEEVKEDVTKLKEEVRELKQKVEELINLLKNKETKNEEIYSD